MTVCACVYLRPKQYEEYSTAVSTHCTPLVTLQHLILCFRNNCPRPLGTPPLPSCSRSAANNELTCASFINCSSTSCFILRCLSLNLIRLLTEDISFTKLYFITSDLSLHVL